MNKHINGTKQSVEAVQQLTKDATYWKVLLKWCSVTC